MARDIFVNLKILCQFLLNFNWIYDGLRMNRVDSFFIDVSKFSHIFYIFYGSHAFLLTGN